MQPVDAVSLYGVIDTHPTTTGLEHTLLVTDALLDLAFADGYPATISLAIGPNFWGGCAHTVDGVWSTSSVEGDSAIATVRLVDAQHVEVKALAEGAASFKVRGHYNGSGVCDEPGTQDLPFEVQLKVFVMAPIGTTLLVPYTCTGATVPHYPVGGALTDLTPALVFKSGALIVDNAEPERQLDVTVHGMSVPRGLQKLSDVVAPDHAVSLELETSIGEPQHVEIVDVSAITSIELKFMQPSVGLVSRELMSGETYEAGYYRNVIAARALAASVNTAQLCTALPADWFTLESQTPEVCQLMSYEEGVFALPMGGPAGRGAKLLADGTCSLTSSLPGAAHGQGLTTMLSAKFTDVATYQQ